MAKKHILMMQTFIKVMLGFKQEIEAVTPDSYYPSIYKIDYQTLKKEKIDTLLFDIDNTITKVDDLNIPKETADLMENLKKQGFKILLFSNNHEQRAKPVAQKLNLPLLSDAGKPTKEAYEKALNILNSNKENTAAIGDQLLSDIVGAKKYRIKAILVDQLSKENNVQTGMAQKLQKHMIKKLKKYKQFQIGKYYISENKTNWWIIVYLFFIY